MLATHRRGVRATVYRSALRWTGALLAVVAHPVVAIVTVPVGRSVRTASATRRTAGSCPTAARPDINCLTVLSEMLSTDVTANNKNSNKNTNRCYGRQQYWHPLVSLLLLLFTVAGCLCNPDAKRLYDDLLSNYNRLIRPVSNNTDTVLVKLGLRLSQLIELVCSPYPTNWFPIL